MVSLVGSYGNDSLAGSAQDDVIAAGWGDDTVSGSAGNDTILDDGGNFTSIAGGLGDDRIVFNDYLAGATVFATYRTAVTLDGGDGNDWIDFRTSRHGTASLLLGAGDDVLVLRSGTQYPVEPQAIRITLGAGQDDVRLEGDLGTILRGTIGFAPFVITDFQAGAGGDTVHLGTLLADIYDFMGANPVYPAANPFASGHLLLVQDGADTVVRLDFDGAGGGDGAIYTRDLLRLENVAAATLTAFNFAGFAPDGSAPLTTTLAGTAGHDRLLAADTGSNANGAGGNDVLLGGAGDDTLAGSAGMDSLAGGRGNDRLLGGNDADVIEGGLGDDFIDGGSGNDSIGDADGNNTILGGLGDDTISVVVPAASAILPPRQFAMAISGGDGNDQVSLTVERFGGVGTRAANVTALVDLGAGDDRFYIDNLRASTVLTLGTGRDRVEFGAQFNYLLSDRQGLIITDFTAGDAGDVLDLGLLLSRSTGWDLVGNPFALGFLRLVQVGADTHVMWDDNGEGQSDETFPIAILRNVAPGSLTAANFGGYDPGYGAGGTAVRNGTAGADALAGGNLADSISGLGGNDTLSGGFGHDTLLGGDGDDLLTDAMGNDSMVGGLGNDTLINSGGGSDTLIGGDGHDRIVLDYAYTFETGTVSVDAGNGNDELVVRVGTGSGSPVGLSANMGAGNDRVTIFYLGEGTASFTLGAGSDVVVLDHGMASQTRGPIIITDFQTGNGGDRLDWLGFMLQFGRDPTPDNDGQNIYNPFYWGQARLIQQGADVLLQMTRGPYLPFGQGPDETLVVFRNTSLTSFTEYNLGVDFALDTAPSTAGADTFGGTAARDVVRGLGGNDRLSGLGGDDLLDGGAGNDSLDGGDGADYLLGGVGNDTLLGGAGDDFLNAGVGRNRIDGGDGNDRFHVDWFDTAIGGLGDDRAFLAFSWYQSIIDSGIPAGSLAMGGGNDTVLVIDGSYAGEAGGFSVDLGSGADRIVVDGAFGTLTLGTGRDRVEMVSGVDSGSELVITDFQTGNLGDVLALGANFAGLDPFATGMVRLTQDGTDVLLQFSQLFWTYYFHDGFTVRFKNTSLAQFTAANFDGFDPQAGPPPASIIIDASNHTVPGGASLVLHNQAFNPTTGGVAGFLYESASGLAQFTNQGRVDISTSGPWLGDLAGFAVSPFSNLTGASRFVNAAGAEFLVHTDIGNVDGVTGRGNFGIRNYGLIAVSTTGEPGLFGPTATGIWSEATSAAGRPINAGTIRVRSSSDAVGAQLWNGSLLTNSGLIDAGGDLFAVGVWVHNAGGQQLNNSGTILARTDPASPYGAIGVLSDGGGTYANSGTIDADFAFYSRAPLANDVPEQFDNTGIVRGLVFMASGDDVVTNAGQMDSRTLLGLGNDRYDGSLGQHTGSVEGGGGADTLLGGAGAENLFGDAGADLIAAGGGADFVEGGLGSDLLDGGSGFDILSYLDAPSAVQADLATGVVSGAVDVDYVRNFEQLVGSSGADTLLGASGAEVFMGWLGADRIDGRAGNDTLLGGQGNDTLWGGTGNDWFVFDAGDGRDTIMDFKPSDRIVIHGYATWQSLQQVGADVRIVLSATDSLLLKNTALSSLTAQNLLFDPAPGGFTIPPLRSATLQPEGALVVDPGALVQLGNTDSFALPGYWVVESTAISGATGVWNAGTIRFATTDAVDQSLGIRLGIGLVNATGARFEVHAANADAVGTWGTEGFWNHGTVLVASDSGNASAAVAVQTIAYSPNPSAFVNTGSIVVTAAGTGKAMDMGANTAAVLMIANSGSILVQGGAASHGIEAWMSAHPAWPDQPRLVNSGTITVTDQTAELDSAGLLLDISSQAQVWNSGTITADHAVRVVRGTSFADYLGYTLALYNSGTLAGRVYLSAYQDTLINTGSIAGDVWLGGGDDLYDGRLGQLTGALDGYDGNDVLLAGAGSQTVLGGFGDDTLSGGSGADVLTGGLGVDVFRYEGGFGHDVITDFQTGPSHDWIDVRGYAGWQSIVQQGADVLITFNASNTLLVRDVQVADLTGGAMRFGAAAMGGNTIPDAPVPPAAPPAPAPVPPDPNLTFLARLGTAGNDTLIGLAGPDDLSGLAGHDLLDGGPGNDILRGGQGNDTYVVDSVADAVIELPGEGVDTVIASVSWGLGDAVEHLQLRSGAGAINGQGNGLANQITGNSSANVIQGLGGNDTLNGQGGLDLIEGGTGNDSLLGSGGNDTLDGGDGADTLIGGAGSDWMAGGLGDDSLIGTGGNDSMLGESGADTLRGGVGLDQLDGGDDADLLAGEAGGDTLVGGAGADTLIGGAARDVLTGGSGGDAFVWALADFGPNLRSGADRITDFSSAQGDVIDLSAVDASTAAAGDQAFAWIGAAGFGGVAGQLRQVADGGNTYVEGDRNGDGLADFAIRLDGLISLTAADFVL